MPVLCIIALRDCHRLSLFCAHQLHAGVILGGEAVHIDLREDRLFLINQLVKHQCFLHFLSFGAIPRLNYGFCVRDPSPLSGPEGHRDSDRPTVIGTQPYASSPFMLFTSHRTKTAQVVRSFGQFLFRADLPFRGYLTKTLVPSGFSTAGDTL